MSYRLVISEKPSVAMSYAKVLGATNRKDGYLEGNGYLVSWCIGHLVELAPPNVYDAKYVKWSIADLPILPQKWQYLVSASTKKQFSILQKLMHRPDVDSIVNSCDAGQCGWVTQEKGKRDLISLKIKFQNHLRSNSNETKSVFRP